MIEGYVWGQEAAELAGMDRADSVWRAIERHGADYPGRIDVEQIGNAYLVRRDELTDFAAWYRANVHRDTRPEKRGDTAELDRRRRTLRRAIAFIQEGQEA